VFIKLVISFVSVSNRLHLTGIDIFLAISFAVLYGCFMNNYYDQMKLLIL